MFDKHIEYYVRYPIENRKVISVTEMVLKSAPNRMHKNGRIYFEDENGNPIAISVSPLHEKFETQIEPGVWPVVKNLVDKGYLTTSSCEGHDDSDFYVKLVFAHRKSAEEFVNQIPNIPGLIITFENQSANVVRYLDQGNVKYRRVLPDEHVSKYEEVKFINMLFYRKYTDCCYVTITLYPNLKSFNPFKNYRYRKEKTKNFHSSKDLLVEFIKNKLTPYEL